MPDPEADDPAAVTYPGAAAPSRTARVNASGMGIATYEWGDEDAPPLFLADGGWRVVAWDQRGHGDSDRAALYSWEADLRDAVAVMSAMTDRPAPVVGHSKGGGLMMQLADCQPFRFSHLVNLDGLPSRRPVPDIANHDRTRMLATDLAGWLDHRRVAADAERKPGTIDELARRRGRMNPRLPIEWLRYLVTTGARHDPDGWRWKIDPMMRFGGFGPWRPEWGLLRMPGLGMPFLAVLGLELEEMGWGTRPDDVLPYLPIGARFEVLPDVGHFVHIERPDLIADAVLDLTGRPS